MDANSIRSASTPDAKARHVVPPQVGEVEIETTPMRTLRSRLEVQPQLKGNEIQCHRPGNDQACENDTAIDVCDELSEGERVQAFQRFSAAILRLWTELRESYESLVSQNCNLIQREARRRSARHEVILCTEKTDSLVGLSRVLVATKEARLALALDISESQTSVTTMAITHELNESKVVASQVQYLRADRKTREEQYLTALHSVRDQRDAVSDLSECPTRIGDLGDYLTRTRSVYGRERLAGLRTDYAADLERRRIAHFRKSYARDHLVEPPVVTVPKEIPPRSLTRTVTLVRYVLPLLQREDQVSFARPDQSREEKFTDYYWRVHAKGENRVEPDRLYVGSERQAEARSIHRRAIKRLFRQVSAQRHEMASLDFAPFYLDVQGGRPVAKLILASEDVARGLKQGLTLSGLLTPHLPDWYTWRNRGPNVHAIVSFKPGCLLTDDQMAQLAKRYLAALGIEIARHRFAVIRHEDARNPHIHFVWSRVRDDGAFISHPAMTRDRVLHLVAGVQDCVVLGKTFRDALGGMSRPCLIGDTLLDRGGSIAWLQLPCGKKNAIPLQGPVAARRIAAVGFLFDECVGGLPKVIGYWGGNSIHSSGRLLDEYLVRE